jgi:hypothetical protein
MYRKSAHSGSLRRMGYLLACVLAAVAVGLGTAGPGTAGGTSFAQYRQHVNRICRSYTPRLKRLDADVARAVRAGNANRAAADFRRLLQLTLAETVDIQKVSVPADARARMRRPLRLLHGFQVQLRRVIAASRTSAPALQLELQRLATMTPPLNRAFDSVGLQDCGSRQQ